jgi:hypothetical protein
MDPWMGDHFAAWHNLIDTSFSYALLVTKIAENGKVVMDKEYVRM